jgi:hypothetical protein
MTSVLSSLRPSIFSNCTSLIQDFLDFLQNRLAEFVDYSSTIRRITTWTQDSETLRFCQTVSKEMGGHAELACIVSGRWSFHSSTPLHNDLSKLYISTPPGDTSFRKSSFRFSTSRMAPGACQSSCKCKCHNALPRQLPANLRRTFRKLFPKTKENEHFVRRCSRLDCRQSNARLGQVAVVLRSNLLNTAILLCVMARSLRFKIQVKKYPIVRESSEIIRYVQLGDLDGLQRIISSGKGTPNDMGEDGWSLLHVRNIRNRR